jgi:homopolymeric O-antigen transport system permease protein
MIKQIKNIQSLYEHRDLLFNWTYRIIRGRYQQSLLGGLWAIIVPTFTALIFNVIFTFFVPINTGNIPYLVFSYAAMVPWTLFSSSITDMVDSLTSNMNLVSKIYFPREILPIASLFARLVDATIAFSLLAVLMLYFRMQVNGATLLLLPFILLIQISFSLGIGLMGGALNVFYRDIRHILVLGLQLWFYASPIIYPVSSVPEKLRSFYFLNPMAGILEAYRAILLYHQLPDASIFISAGVAILVLALGYSVFKRAEFQFADII